MSEGETYKDSEGKGNRRGGDGNSLKINRQKCFIKSALMQSIHSNKCSCTATAALLRQAIWFYTLCFHSHMTCTHIIFQQTLYTFFDFLIHLQYTLSFCGKMGEQEENVCCRPRGSEVWWQLRFQPAARLTFPYLPPAQGPESLLICVA